MSFLEELSDVFIYSLRLCDICNIDLAEAVNFCMLHRDDAVQMATSLGVEFRCSGKEWSHLEYGKLKRDLLASEETGKGNAH